MKLRTQLVKRTTITGAYEERHHARVTLDESGYTLMSVVMPGPGLPIRLVGEKVIAEAGE